MIRSILLVLILSILFCGNAFSAGIVQSKHNLSVTGPGPIKAASEQSVCLFCHTPKKARKRIPFLWSRKDSNVHYKPYHSSTLKSSVGQPTGSSRICLSCHDGTIALGNLVTRQHEVAFSGGIRFIPAQQSSRIGTDLSDDHPVSFVYDGNLSLIKGGLADPSGLPSQVKLDRSGQLQCTACHDPHDDAYGKFLVMSNRFSGLCTTCHEISGWYASSHATSGSQWNGQGTDPWAGRDYRSVAENGCENCHRSHRAGKHERLLNFAFEEDNCLICHSGSVARTAIDLEISKPYGHKVHDYYRDHDPAEDFSSTGVPKHVECEDCHNPHRVNGDPAPGPGSVSGANQGVTGVNRGGNPVQYANKVSEICYKCHGDNNVIRRLPVTRQVDQLNTRLQFDTSNPAFHPVEGPGVNRDVPSLKSTLTPDTTISCIDCHNSDNPAGPKGPHGSRYQYLLKKNYVTQDFTRENANNYELCYECHVRSSILANESFTLHREHIVDQKAPCSICHDPHGISISKGGSEANNSHLINFDLSVVYPNGSGGLYFQDLGRFSGQCFLRCHGKDHAPEIYP